MGHWEAVIVRGVEDVARRGGRSAVVGEVEVVGVGVAEEVEEGGAVELGVVAGGSLELLPVLTVVITESVVVNVEMFIMVEAEGAAALEVEGVEVGDSVTAGSTVIVTIEFARQPTPVHV